MPCWIQVVQDGDHSTVLVAGRLEQAHVPDLIRACAQATGPVALDLTDVLFTDPIALDAIRRIRDDGVTLIGLPKYLQFRLDGVE